MPKLSLVNGTTSKSVGIAILNSAASTGVGLTGLAYNTASMNAYYVQAGVTGATVINLATLASATAAWSSGGFIEIDSTHMPGIYRLDIPNAVLTGATSADIMIAGAANAAPCRIEIELTAWNNQDAVHGGLTALPNTAVTTNASLLTSGTGTDQLSVSAGKVILQATQTGVTIPIVTTVSGNVSGNVNGSVGSISGVTFPSNFGTLVIDSNGNVKIQGAVKINTALAGFQFYMALTSDHVSPGTGKTITATRSINGGAFASCANVATEIGSGWYTINLAASDLNGATVALSFAAASCDTTILTITTQP